MSSILYGLALIFIVVVIFWWILNERRDADGAGLGILGTKAPSEFKPRKVKKKRRVF
jgi:hypothetical protein